jgi:hypothetical protein
LGCVGLALSTAALIIYLKKKKGVLITNIVAMTLCVTSIIVGICVTIPENNRISNDTESILANDIDVTFGQYIIENVQGTEKGELIVTVKNKTDKEYSFNLTIEALDEDGIRVEVTTIYVREISAGQTVKERAFGESNVSALKTAVDFRVTKASRYSYY